MAGDIGGDTRMDTTCRLAASVRAITVLNSKNRPNHMSKGMPVQDVDPSDEDSFSSATAVAALLFLAEKFPHRQFTSTELSIISGIGRTAMSQIKNAEDSPFSLGKCTMRRLDRWLSRHPGFKQS